MNSITRSVIIDDAFNLAQNGHLNYSILIDLVDCWRSQETEYLPWKILLDNLNTIYQYAADLPVFKDMKVGRACRVPQIGNISHSFIHFDFIVFYH